MKLFILQLANSTICALPESESEDSDSDDDDDVFVLFSISPVLSPRLQRR